MTWVLSVSPRLIFIYWSSHPQLRIIVLSACLRRTLPSPVPLNFLQLQSAFGLTSIKMHHMIHHCFFDCLFKIAPPQVSEPLMGWSGSISPIKTKKCLMIDTSMEFVVDHFFLSFKHFWWSYCRWGKRTKRQKTPLQAYILNRVWKHYQKRKLNRSGNIA